MAKTLRETDHPQFTNKNAELTNSELDETLIELQADINTANGLSLIQAYASGTEYRLNQFVSYEYVIYKFISDSPQSAVTPGTDESVWEESSMAEMLLNQNIIVVKHSELTDIITAKTIQPGRWYYIYDAAVLATYGNSALALGLTNSQFARMGYLITHVADFQNDGDYSGVESFAGQLGLWLSTSGTLDYLGIGGFVIGETITGGISGATAVIVSDTPVASPLGGTISIKNIVGTFQNGEDIEVSGSPAVAGTADGTVTYTFNPQTGNVVIWNCKHYRKKTDTIISTEPDDDGTNYELLSFDETNGYMKECDTVIGLWETLIMKRRWDKRGNDISNEVNFQWGNDLVTNNVCHAGITLAMRNYYGTMNGCLFQGYGTFVFDESETDYEGVVFNGGSTDVGEVIFESGSFTLSADGSTATLGMNGATPSSHPVIDNGDGTFTITIPTAKTLKLAFFNIKIPNNSTSSGIDNGIIHNVNHGIQGTDNQTVSIKAYSNPNETTGLITDIRATEFDITLTQVGAGVAITSQFHLQEKNSI